VKKLIVFDLDGTLAESKASVDAEMAKLLDSLLTIVKVSVISGGAWEQFEKQIVAHLSHDERLKNLSLLPTCGTKFYRYEAGWKLLYSEDFTDSEKKKIIGALDHTIVSPGSCESLGRDYRRPGQPDHVLRAGSKGSPG
jgi:phosphomannomutase